MSPIVFFGGDVYIEGEFHRTDLTIRHGQIVHIGRARSFRGVRTVDARGCILCPGWINAHDHLDLSCYPRLAPNAPYVDGHAWGMDVLAHLAQISRIPLAPDPGMFSQNAIPPKRHFAWGVLRNLSHGVTTVSHHNAAPSLLLRLDLPIRLHTTPFWVHSIRQARRLGWIAALAKSVRQPMIIHAAEAISGPATAEISWLGAHNSLHEYTILVHAVSATPEELDILYKKKTGVVACVTSNRFVLGKSPDLAAWNRHNLRAGLGTDSSLTASGGMLDELAAAVTYGGLSPTQAVRWATTGGADLLRMRVGQLRAGWPADLVVYRARAPRVEHMVYLRPEQIELVCLRGRPELAAPQRKDDMEQLGRNPKAMVVHGNEVWLDRSFADLLAGQHADR